MTQLADTPPMTAADHQRHMFGTELLTAVRRHRLRCRGAGPLPISREALRAACQGYSHGRPTLPSEDVVTVLVEWMGDDVLIWLQWRAQIEGLEDNPEPSPRTPPPAQGVPWPSAELLHQARMG